MEPALVADLRSTWALVPLRGLEDAKTRLGGELDPEERLELVVAMARRTLLAARGTSGIVGTVLVTADPAAADMAAELGARTIVQRLPGLNAALREARAGAVELGATAVLILPIDLPAVSPARLEEVLADAARAMVGPPAARSLVFAVPDRRGEGTNVLLVTPPASIEPAFGEGSLQAHAEAAAAAGATFRLHGGPLTLDVDTGDDLLAVEAAGGHAAGGPAAVAGAAPGRPVSSMAPERRGP